jgi:hypothetical protein
MDVQPIRGTENVPMTEIHGHELASLADRLDRDPSDACRDVLCLCPLWCHPIVAAVAEGRRPMHQPKVRLCYRSRGRYRRHRARRRRWHAIWLPGRTPTSRRADLASV